METAVYPKNMWRLVGLMIISCISPFFVGCSIFLSAAASDEAYKKYYSIPLGKVLSFSMINGAVPLGGILGSMTLPYMLKYTNKRDIALVHFVAATLFCGITEAPYFECLMVGRFLLGIICAWENSIGAVLIKEYAPLNYRSLFGALFLTARAAGITFIFAISYIFDYEPNDIEFRLINMIPAFISLLQLVLLWLFAPHTPADLVARNRTDELRDFASRIYAKEDIDKVVSNCIR